MLIPSKHGITDADLASLSRRVNANSQHAVCVQHSVFKLIKKGEC